MTYMKCWKANKFLQLMSEIILSITKTNKQTKTLLINYLS